MQGVVCPRTTHPLAVAVNLDNVRLIADALLSSCKLGVACSVLRERLGIFAAFKRLCPCTILMLMRLLGVTVV